MVRPYFRSVAFGHSLSPPQAPIINIITTMPPDATENSPYQTQCLATGGTAPYTWSDMGGWPTGMSLGSNGILSGTPTVDGQFLVDVICTDAQGYSSALTEVTLNVIAEPTPGAAFNGPNIGFGFWVGEAATRSNLSSSWTVKTMAEGLVDLGADWIVAMVGRIRGYGGGYAPGTGPGMDDHEWCNSTQVVGGVTKYYNDLGQEISGPSYGPQQLTFSPALAGKVYCGIYLPGYNNYQDNTFIPWNDNTKWALFCREMTNICRWVSNGHTGNFKASSVPCVGIATDWENSEYFAPADWRYSGLSEATARQLAYQRGQEFMAACVAGWNTAGVGHGIRIINYYMDIMPSTWMEEARKRSFGDPSFTFKDRLFREFWAGASTVSGFDSLFMLSSAYYKTPFGNLQPDAAGWDTSMQWDEDHFRPVILSYDNPADPYNAYRQWGNINKISWGMFGWWDRVSPTAGSINEQIMTPSAALVQVQRAKLNGDQNIVGIYVYQQSQNNSNSVNYSQYTDAITAFP